MINAIPITSLRMALREMRGGIKGFRIFMLCLILGVTTITAVLNISGSVLQALERDGRAILGGDLLVRQLYQPLNVEQMRWFEDRTTQISESVEMRSMALSEDRSANILVELKAVDSSYPLAGQAEVLDGNGETRILSDIAKDRIYVDRAVLNKLGLSIGDSMRLGFARFTIGGVLSHEPDRLGAGRFALFAPRVMISLSALEDTKLIQRGSLVNYYYRMILPPGTATQALKEQAQQAFPENAWRIRDFRDASPQLRRMVDRLTLFMTLVGLTSLLVGGVGISNAVRSFLDSRLNILATMKCIGADGAMIVRIYLSQITIMALIAIAVGLATGYALPLIFQDMIRNVLPLDIDLSTSPTILLIAALFGLLTTLTFSLWPLGQTHNTKPVDLFRDRLTPGRARPPVFYMIGTAISGLMLAGLSVAIASDYLFALWFVIGAGLSFIAFRIMAQGIIMLAKRIPRPRSPVLRLALTNLYRPGNPTVNIVLSLGLGLTLLVAVALIEGNFRHTLENRQTAETPAFFFLDIQPGQIEAFRTALTTVEGARDLKTTPHIRGRIKTVNGIPAEQAVIDESEGWVARGDRGITYRATLPENSEIIAGDWWPETYDGPPLLSVVEDVQRAFGLKIGDSMTINILGRDITATIGNIRDVEWGNFTINFSLTFAPGTLEPVPQTWLATIRAEADAEIAIQNMVARQFPNVTSIRVREAIEAVDDIIGNVSLAIQIIAAIAILTGTLVLIGAIAATHTRRVYDSVVLKVLGATRYTIGLAFLLEYGLLGLIAGLLAAVIGTIAAWSTLTYIMDVEWVFLPLTLAGIIALCSLVTILLGFMGTWRALSHPAAPLLRNE